MFLRVSLEGLDVRCNRRVGLLLIKERAFFCNLNTASGLRIGGVARATDAIQNRTADLADPEAR